MKKHQEVGAEALAGDRKVKQTTKNTPAPRTRQHLSFQGRENIPSFTQHITMAVLYQPTLWIKEERRKCLGNAGVAESQGKAKRNTQLGQCSEIQVSTGGMSLHSPGHRGEQCTGGRH